MNGELKKRVCKEYKGVTNKEGRYVDFVDEERIYELIDEAKKEFPYKKHIWEMGDEEDYQNEVNEWFEKWFGTLTGETTEKEVKK